MQFDTIIANGTVVTSESTAKLDVGIRGEKIVAVRKNLAQAAKKNGTRIVDASGRYVIPGGVDVHVHLELPFCGTVSSDDYDSGTKAAARGGVTTVIDFAIPYGDESLQDAVDNWMAKAEGKACVDYTFHVALTNWQRHAGEMKGMVDQGLPTFKQFMIYAKEGWQADDAAIFGALEKCRELGGMLLIHAESSRILDELIERRHNADEMHRLGAQLHGITRPNYIEAEAIQRAITWAEATGGRLFIVHMSTHQAPIWCARPKSAAWMSTPKRALNTWFWTTRNSRVKTDTSTPAARRSRRRRISSAYGKGSSAARSARSRPTHAPSRAGRKPCGTATGRKFRWACPG